MRRLGTTMVFSLVLACRSPVVAQTTQGLIAGRLIDSQSGAPIAGGQVTYWNEATAANGTANSDAGGNFFLPLLSPGLYRVRAAANRYQAREVQELELPVAARLELNFELRPLNDVWEAGQYRSVLLPGSKTVVTFFGPDVDSSRSGSFEATKGRRGALESTVSTVINPLQVEQLPLAGRDVYTMLVTLPGVTADAGTSRGLGISVNGQRPSSSNFLLDGLENNNYLVTGPLTAVAPEAIQEYRVSTNNFSAEYGRTSGFVANAVSRSGGNRFHGIGYAYLKNEALNANGFQENRAGLERTPAKEQRFGYQVGGPIRKDRLFFSSAFEALRSRSRQDAFLFNFPTPAFLRFVASNSIAKKLLTQYAPPAVSNGPAFTAPLALSPPVSVDQSLANERVDYSSPGGADRLMGRVALARVSRPDFIWSPYPDFISGLHQNTLSVAASWSRQIRPGLLNELKGGRTTDDLGWGRAHPEVPTLRVNDNGAAVTMPGSLASYAYSNQSGAWEFLDSLIWTRGRHLTTAGVGLLRRSSDGFLTAFSGGEYLFGGFDQSGFPTNGLLDFAFDRPRSLTTALARQSLPRFELPDYNRRYRYNQYFFFLQDTFKLTSRLALNYGVRYEQFGAPRNVGAVKDATLALGQGSGFPARLAGARLVFPGSGDQPLYQADKNNWAVRFGFSYDLTGNARTLVRGAYGIFYDRPFDNEWQNVRSNSFVAPILTIRAATTDYLQPVASVLQTLPPQPLRNDFPNITFFDPSLRNGYLQTYFFGIQQQASENWTLEVNALGSLGRRLLVTDLVNRAFSNPSGRFNNAFPDIAYRAGQGLSNYQALAVAARYRARRSQFQLSYTWSHSIDHQSDPLAGDFFDLSVTRVGGGGSPSSRATFSRQFDMRADRGNSDFDQRHNLVFLSLWEIPPLAASSKAGVLFRDWRFSQLAAFRSGFPYSIQAASTVDTDNPQGVIFNNRADLVDPKAAVLSPRAAVPGGFLLLNEAAFRQPPLNAVGNTGRNAFRGPGLYNIDIALSRSFPLRWLGEAGRLTFRADAFNVFNHANLNSPCALIGNPCAGGNDFGVAQFGRQGKQTGFPAVTPFTETGRQVQLIFRVEF